MGERCVSVCVSIGREGPSWCFELAKSRVDEEGAERTRRAVRKARSTNGDAGGALR